MEDDLLVISRCGTDSVISNSVIKSLIESKKLNLIVKKCSKIHIGKIGQSCPDLKVHGMNMESSKLEKYLGDLISHTGRNRTNIEDRTSKGFGICNQILAILSEVPLGKHKIGIGLLLRQAVFINGILFNSEAWQSIYEEEIKLLEDIDNYCCKLIAKHQLHSFILKPDLCPSDLFWQTVDRLSTTQFCQGQKRS